MVYVLTHQYLQWLPDNTQKVDGTELAAGAVQAVVNTSMALAGDREGNYTTRCVIKISPVLKRKGLIIHNRAGWRIIKRTQAVKHGVGGCY